MDTPYREFDRYIVVPIRAKATESVTAAGIGRGIVTETLATGIFIQPDIGAGCLFSGVEPNNALERSCHHGT